MTTRIESDGTRTHWTNPIQGVEWVYQGSRSVGNDTVALFDTLPSELTGITTEYIRFIAPTPNHTAGQNTTLSYILIGQNETSNVVGGVGLYFRDAGGIIYPCRDPSLVYLTGFNATDAVEFQIFKY